MTTVVFRWGPTGVADFKANLDKLLTTVKSSHSPTVKLIWINGQPVGKSLESRAMNVPGLEFQKETTRYHVVETNFYASHKVKLEI